MNLQVYVQEAKAAGYTDLHVSLEVRPDGTFIRVRPVGGPGKETTFMVQGVNVIQYSSFGSWPSSDRPAP